MKFYYFAAPLLLLAAACSDGGNTYDATGTFEAKEVIVSASTAGRLLNFTAAEGQQLKANDIVAIVDTTQLYLKKKQLEAQIRAVLSREPDIPAQLAALQEQIHVAQTEKVRITNLTKAGVAPQKQLDDINNQIAVLQKQLEAQQSILQKSAGSVYAEVEPLMQQIDQVNDQLMQSKVLNPIDGTVLVTYMEAGEYAAPGKALYKVGDLKHMQLRAYITGEQLPLVKLGQQVQVTVDGAEGKGRNYTGKVSWISDKAEFTPKTIMTSDERSNLVYAIRIDVDNDDMIKIGMYGEVLFK